MPLFFGRKKDKAPAPTTVSSPADAKAAVKALQLQKKELAIRKRAIAEQVRLTKARHAERMLNVPSNWDDTRSDARHKSEHKEKVRSEQARDLAPLEKQRAAIESQIAAIDTQILRLQQSA